MEVIKDTVKNVLQALEAQKKESPEDALRSLLKTVFTKKELGHVKFHYFKKGILTINVDSSTWLYYLSLQKEKLLTKMRKKYKTIKDIRLHLGEC